MRMALGIEYNGSAYHGWERQQQAITVQSCVEQALSKVANQTIEVICAGRTDAKVHAFNQVIHFDTTAERSIRAWVLGGNAYLPTDISIVWGKRVDSEFHARFSALSRSYRYIILNRMTRPAVFKQLMTWYCHQLDVNRMHKAAQLLLGEHDFTSYRAKACQSKQPIRTIYQLDVTREHDKVIVNITANGFLQHMVRNIVGVLFKIGRSEQAIDWTQDVLSAKDRRCGGITAPPDGLYFTNVAYPEKYQIPQVPITI